MVRAEALGKLESTATWPVLPSATVLLVTRLEFVLPVDTIVAGTTTIGVPAGTTPPPLAPPDPEDVAASMGDEIDPAGDAVDARGDPFDVPGEPPEVGLLDDAPVATLMAELSALPN